MIYFAYGSNLDPRQMAERCPRSPAVAVARLDDHRLTFPLRSPIRRCAVASIEPFPGGIVWGVLYRLHDEDLVRLDTREGHFPDRPEENRYERVDIPVLFGRETITAMTYVARPSPDPGLPSPVYLAHLLFGATHHGLPEDYVAMLKELQTAPADASLIRDGSVDASKTPG